MENNFICPKCSAYLNIGKQLILSATTALGESGLILFNQELGNYTVESNPGFVIKQGEKYTFFCPVCKERLASKSHDNLSRIIMIDHENKQYEILFSQIAGEKSTYKIIGESIETFGDEQKKYIDFINLSLTK